MSTRTPPLPAACASCGGALDPSCATCPRCGRLPAPVNGFGPYDLREPIGRGTTAVVFRAIHRVTNRVVALKVFDDAAPRFAREARAVAALDHPNIVRLHDAGDVDGRPYIAMQLVEGRTLKEEMADAPRRPDSRLLRALEQAARGLDHAHANGVLHRDLKPSNVLVSRDGRAFVSDFGLARIAAEPSMTESGLMVGTPCYMSPEQACGRASAVGPRTDVYALGVILYEMIAGRAPFEGTTVFEIAGRVVNEPPPSPPEHPLASVALRAIAKEPSARHATAGAFADDLRRFLDGGALPPPRRRSPVPWLAAVVIAIVVAAILLARPSARSSSDPPRLNASEPFQRGLAALADAERALGHAPELARDRAAAARDAFVETLRRDPAHADAPLLLGRAHEMLDAPGAAREAYTRAIERGSALAHFHRARLALRGIGSRSRVGPDPFYRTPPRADRAQMQRMLADASVDVESAIRLGLEPERRLLLDGWRAFAEGPPAAAVTPLAAYLDRFPLDAEAHVLLGLALLDDGRWEEAERPLSRAASLAPSNLAILAARGRVRWALARVDEAAADFAAAGDRTSLSALRLAQGRLDEAVAEARAALPDAAARGALARVLVARGLVAEAEREITAAIAQEPLSGLYLVRAMIYDETGRAAEARRDLDEAVRLDPLDYAAFANRGILRGMENDLEGAVEDLTHAISLAPREPRLHVNRGRANLGLHRFADGERDYTEALRLSPKLAEAHDGRGRCRMGLERWTDALADLREAVRLEPARRAALDPLIRDCEERNR